MDDDGRLSEQRVRGRLRLLGGRVRDGRRDVLQDEGDAIRQARQRRDGGVEVQLATEARASNDHLLAPDLDTGRARLALDLLLDPVEDAVEALEVDGEAQRDPDRVRETEARTQSAEGVTAAECDCERGIHVGLGPELRARGLERASVVVERDRLGRHAALMLFEPRPGIGDAEAADVHASDLDTRWQVPRLGPGEERADACERAQHDDRGDRGDAPGRATGTASVQGVGPFRHVPDTG